MVHGDSQAAVVGEPIREFCAGAEFPPRAELGALATGEIAGGAGRGQHPVRTEIDVEPKPAIAVERAVAGTRDADKRRDNPELIAESVFGACFGSAFAVFVVAGGDVE